MKALRSPYLLLLLAPLALFAPALLSGRSLYWGTPLLQFIPWRFYAWERLLTGELPLWNPLLGMGAPLAANHQSALFYPPNWLGLLLTAVNGVHGLAWGNALLVAAHLVWAGLGMARLARRLGLDDFSQATAGLALGLSGYLIGRAGFFSINASAAWLPWIILFCTPREPGVLPNWRSRETLKLALAVAMQFLGGHAQTTWYSLLLAGVWACAWGWRISGWRGALKGALRLLLAGLGAAVLAGVQLLPTLEYMLQSQRSGGLDYQLAATYSYWPWRLLTLFAPGMFGSPVSGDYWGYGNYWEDHLYIGVLPLLLAIVALVSSTRRRNPSVESLATRWLVGLLAILMTGSMLLALGDNLPLYPWLYAHAPTFSFFQAPTRISIVAVFSLALLAGLGAHTWRPPQRRALYWTRLGTAGAFAITLGAGMGWALLGEVSPTFIRALARAGLWACASGVLALAMPLDGPGDRAEVQTARRFGLTKRAWSWLVLVFISLDLLAASWGLNPSKPLSDFLISDVDLRALESELAGGRLYLPEADEYALRYQRFFRFDTFELDEPAERLSQAMLPNLNMLYGIASANNYDPLVPGRYARFLSVLDHLEASGEQDQSLKLMNLTGISVVERKSASTQAGVSRMRLQGSSRLYWAQCARWVASEEEALAALQSSSFDPQGEVLLEGESPELAENGCNPSAEETRPLMATLSLVEERASRVRIRVEAPQPGWVVLTDTWYPGWVATVDGERQAVERADYLFRAVRVGAGEHLVEFNYQPVVFYAGGMLTMLGCVLVVFLWRKSTDE